MGAVQLAVNVDEVVFRAGVGVQMWAPMVSAKMRAIAAARAWGRALDVEETAASLPEELAAMAATEG